MPNVKGRLKMQVYRVKSDIGIRFYFPEDIFLIKSGDYRLESKVEKFKRGLFKKDRYVQICAKMLEELSFFQLNLKVIDPLGEKMRIRDMRPFQIDVGGFIYLPSISGEDRKYSPQYWRIDMIARDRRTIKANAICKDYNMGKSFHLSDESNSFYLNYDECMDFCRIKNDSLM